jgi:quinol monooxygenase YgiN
MRLLTLLLGLATMPLAVAAHAQQTPPPAPAGPVHVVTYVEVKPSSAGPAIPLLRQYRDAGRKEAGNERSEIAQEVGRKNRFVILEIWKDQAAFDAHGKAAETAAFREKLKSIAAAPYDERVHGAFAVGPNAAVPKGAVIVVSHVDVPPPRKDELTAALNPLADGNRKADGNARFEVVQQTSRPNHFTVVEAWKGQKAYDARVGAAPQLTFREKLAPMLGALYDERIYQGVD